MGVTSVRNNHELMLMSQDGTVIRVQVESVRCTGRNTMGVRVMNLRGADKVSSMARLVGGTNGNGHSVDGNGGEAYSGSEAGLVSAYEETDDLEDSMDVEDDGGEDIEPGKTEKSLLVGAGDGPETPAVVEAAGGGGHPPGPRVVEATRHQHDDRYSGSGERLAPALAQHKPTPAWRVRAGCSVEYHLQHTQSGSLEEEHRR